MLVKLDEIKKYITDGNNEPTRVLNIYGDIFPDEKNERNILNLVYQTGIVNEIINSKVVDKILVNRWILRLINDFSMQSNAAIFAVCEWVKFYHGIDFSKEISIQPPIQPPT